MQHHATERNTTFCHGHCNQRIRTWLKRIGNSNRLTAAPLHSCLTKINNNIFAANFGREVVKGLPVEIETGIYFGWASVDSGDIHKMVMSIGWNPFYHNTEKSMVRVVLRCSRDRLASHQLNLIVLIVRARCHFKQQKQNFNEL